MINDYATLQAWIASELARSDLNGSIPTFIQLAEADINRTLRTRKMQAIVTGTSAGQVITLPEDYRETEALYVTFGGVGVEIFPLPPQRLADILITGGPPAGYVVVGDEIRLVGGAGDLSYSLLYFQELPPSAPTVRGFPRPRTSRDLPGSPGAPGPPDLPAFPGPPLRSLTTPPRGSRPRGERT